jgi:hypothetical protein
MARSGGRWRDLPERLGDYDTVTNPTLPPMSAKTQSWPKKPRHRNCSDKLDLQLLRGAAGQDRTAWRLIAKAWPLCRSVRSKAARTIGSRIRLEIGQPISAAETLGFCIACANVASITH